MTLNHSQKKYLKKNLRLLSLPKIANELNLPEKELSDYLQKTLPKNKYEKITTDNITRPLYFVNNFSFTLWIKSRYKSVIFLCFLVFAVYANSLFGDFLSDDISGISQNPNINHLSHFIFPRLPFFSPLYFLQSFIYALFGPVPFFYHLLNVSLHLGSVLAIFITTDLLFAFPIALFVAGLFAVHPLLTESVAWISAMPYTLSSLFLLLSFLIYITGKNKTASFFSLFSFFLGLISNEKIVVFPLILFLYELSFGNLKKFWRKLLSFFALSGFFAFLYLSKIAQVVSVPQASFYQYQEAGINNPFLQIPIAVTSYLQLLFFPKDLSFYHTELSFTQTEFLIKLIIFIIFIILIIFSFFKNRRIFFWLSFFLILLSPTLNPLGIGWIVAERYVYLASLGIIAIIGLLIQKIGAIFKKPAVAVFLFSFLLFLFSLRTIMRNLDFQNQDHLWLATAKTSPSSSQNHNNLGDYYGRHGNLEKAAEEFKIAIKLLPNYGDAYHNLANIYAQMGKLDQAIENYQKAISTNPNLWQSYQNLGIIYLQLGDKQKAAQNFQEALNINPQNQSIQEGLKESSQ